MEVCDGQAPLMRAWSCTISTHMRSLGKVLATFDKIGRDLFIEAAPDRLLLRTLNQAQSVFCLCTLPLALFDDFTVGHDAPNVRIWLKVRTHRASVRVARPCARLARTPIARAHSCSRSRSRRWSRAPSRSSWRRSSARRAW